jgi:hypothetical protein
VEEDPCTPFVVAGGPIEVTPGGGRIGRLYWSNQAQFTVEVWAKGEDLSLPPADRSTTEIPGSCALISTLGDWIYWVMG